MGFWDVLKGQTKPRPARLDALFSLPSAAMTLEASLGLQATGEGSVCFRAAEGKAPPRLLAGLAAEYFRRMTPC